MRKNFKEKVLRKIMKKIEGKTFAPKTKDHVKKFCKRLFNQKIKKSKKTSYPGARRRRHQPAMPRRRRSAPAMLLALGSPRKKRGGNKSGKRKEGVRVRVRVRGGLLEG